jgi:hypothetical protein
MYKKTLMIKSIDVIICDIEQKHDLFFFEVSIRWKVRQCNLISQKDFNENDSLKLTFAIKTLLIKNDQLIEKN